MHHKQVSPAGLTNKKLLVPKHSAAKAGLEIIK
jgi:hypothetical protein